MNAEARAPATSSSNSAFGILNAARNASSCGVAPKVAPMTESRNQPRMRLAISAPIITIDARATDIVTERSMKRRVRLSFAAYGHKEAQAFSSQAHPADHPPHLDQDARPLGRADRREGSTRRDREGRRGRRIGGRGGVEHPRSRLKARSDPQERRAPRPQPRRQAREQGRQEEVAARPGSAR